MISQSQKSEIDVYLEEEPENNIEDFDVLSWWRSKAAKFPVLSAMARDFLAIPLSTVSSESAFSLGGRILGDHRSSLAPEMLEALVCGKDWLYKTKDPELCSDGEGMTSLHLFLTTSLLLLLFRVVGYLFVFFCLINVYSFTVCRS